MAELAEALGHPEDARHYREMAQSLRASFSRQSLRADGTVEGDTLTGYALALRLGLVPEKKRVGVIQRFLARLEKDVWRPRVGYDGVAHLLPALSAAGRSDLALRVLLSEGFPSWSEMLAANATTIGEAWLPDGSSSLNRFGLGSCGEWLFEDLLGLQPAAPGFRRLRVRPAIGCGLEFAEGAFESVYGRITVAWRIKPGRATLTLNVPPNVTAEVWLPARTGGNASGAAAEIQESGTPLAKAVGVKMIEKKEGATVVETGSGDYRFEWAW
jgi:alpha-L-rhamnosidase